MPKETQPATKASMRSMEQNQKSQSRPWLYGAMFVWALTGAVAYATYSSQPTPSATLVSASPESSALPASAPANSEPAMQSGSAPSKIVWEPTFEAAMQKARTENKPIMVDFYTDWCGWCKEMDKQVYPDKAVVAEAANWVSIKINAEKRPDVASAYGVTGYPTVVFAETSGKPIEILPGFAPAADFTSTMVAARAKFKK